VCADDVEGEKVFAGEVLGIDESLGFAASETGVDFDPAFGFLLAFFLDLVEACLICCCARKRNVCELDAVGLVHVSSRNMVS